jgi:hypothetical protein
MQPSESRRQHGQNGATQGAMITCVMQQRQPPGSSILWPTSTTTLRDEGACWRSGRSSAAEEANCWAAGLLGCWDAGLLLSEYAGGALIKAAGRSKMCDM